MCQLHSAVLFVHESTPAHNFIEYVSNLSLFLCFSLDATVISSDDSEDESWPWLSRWEQWCCKKIIEKYRKDPEKILPMMQAIVDS